MTQSVASDPAGAAFPTTCAIMHGSEKGFTMPRPRLYVEADLFAEARIEPDSGQIHHLLNVLRLGGGDSVRLFNGRDGEWEGGLVALTRKKVEIAIDRQIRVQQCSPDLELLFAPLKKDRTDFTVEKAAELGVRRIQPVLTERTNQDHVRPDRLRAIAIGAAEQSERLDVPVISAQKRLDAVLRGWTPGRILLFADESGDDRQKPWGGDSGRAPPAAEVITRIVDECVEVPLSILVGPEGGFTPEERANLRHEPWVRPVGLGPTILRAETASTVLLGLVQALWGSKQLQKTQHGRRLRNTPDDGHDD